MGTSNNTKKENTPSHPHEGVIAIASNKVGYVPIDGIEEDVQIQSEFLNTALHGDTVSIAILPKQKDDTRMQGEVIEVLERARDELVGTIDKKNAKKTFAFLVPDDPRIHTDIFIPDAQKKDIKHNYKALVKITDWGDTKKNPSGEIVRVLGKRGDNDVEMNAILLETGIRPEFPDEVQRAAAQIHSQSQLSNKERSRRKDLTDITTFTIDPSDAKDLDDALSVRKKGEHIEVGIHIADVSHYVQEGTELDLHARDRGTSVYLVDRVAPMLPEELSNDLCSLNPNEEKLAFSALLEMDTNGKVVKRWFGKTIIRSNARLSYSEAQERLHTGEGAYAEELLQLEAMTKILREERERRGALTFDREEVTFDLDEKGKPVRVYTKEPLYTHKLVEEFMIMANREVAGYLAQQQKKQNGLALFRVHDVPTKRNLNDLMHFLNALGYTFNVPEEHLTAKQLNSMIQAVHGTDKEALVEAVAMRDMEKAVYTLENRGHYGLALETYTHFTSPIRRYADLMVHRILQGYLEGNPPPTAEKSSYKKILATLNQREIRAVGAERTSVKYKQMEYILANRQKVYEGIVSGVSKWGMFVQEKTTHAEGLVRARDMQDDFYILDEDGYSLIGTKTKKKFTIGDPVKIKVSGEDMDRKMLDFTLVQ